MVGVTLQGESGGGVAGQSLQVTYGLAALREEREATMLKPTQMPYGLLHSCCTRPW